MSLWRGCGACSEQRRAAARSLGVPARQAPPTVPARQQACSVPRSQHPADGAHLGAARRRPSASPAICAPPPVDRGGRNQARWRQRVAPVKLTTRLLSDHSRVSSASPAECAPPPVDSNRQTGSTRHRQCGWFACCPCRPLCHSDHHSLCRPTHPPTHPTCLAGPAAAPPPAPPPPLPPPPPSRRRRRRWQQARGCRRASTAAPPRGRSETCLGKGEDGDGVVGWVGVVGVCGGGWGGRGEDGWRRAERGGGPAEG